MPRIEAVMEKARIMQWLKKEGEAIAKGEALALAEGEKTTFEIPSPSSGSILKLLFKEGSDVPVGELIAILGNPGDVVPSTQIKHEVASPTIAPSVEVTGQSEPKLAGVNVSPGARKLAREHGVDLTTLIGTGPGGSIIRVDVEKAIAQKTAPSPSVAALNVAQVIPFSHLRKTIAERLSRSFHTTAGVLITTQANVDRALFMISELRREGKGDFTLTALTVKAVSEALKKHPTLNAMIENDALKIFSDINIAVAVDTAQGLYAPVIRNVEKKSVFEIAEAIRLLSEKAEKAQLNPQEVSGSTFTVTNLGSEDVEVFAPIINPPNVAILGVGKAQKRPVVLDDRIAVANVMMLSLVFDHRAIDGRPAAAFLKDLKRLLENSDDMDKSSIS